MAAFTLIEPQLIPASALGQVQPHTVAASEQLRSRPRSSRATSEGPPRRDRRSSHMTPIQLDGAFRLGMIA